MTERFTAAQWAEIEGGHEMTPDKSEPMSFIKDLQEARMLRDENNARVLTYTDCIERMYLTLLCLEIMRHFPTYTNTVRDYAKKTTRKSATYEHFSLFSSDLYNLLHFIDGPEEALNKLKDPVAAKKMASSVTLPKMKLNRYLSQLAHDAKPTEPSDFFGQLERSLKVSNTDYKAIRRFATNIRKSSPRDKEQYITRLVLAVRAKLRNSDIVEPFLKFVSDNNFEIDTVPDNEPTVSLPDIDTSKNMQLYKNLVGSKNLMQTKQFLDHAKNGKSMPSLYVQGYLPIVKMVDDIVKAGPAYVSQLQYLHQRVKNKRK